MPGVATYKNISLPKTIGVGQHTGIYTATITIWVGQHGGIVGVNMGSNLHPTIKKVSH